MIVHMLMMPSLQMTMRDLILGQKPHKIVNEAFKTMNFKNFFVFHSSELLLLARLDGDVAD